MIINLTVKDRCITIPYGYTRPTEGDVGTVHVSFDIQDDDFLDVDKRVTFSNFGGGVSVSLDFADTIEVPHEVITHDGFFISVTAYDPDNKLIARTHRMLKSAGCGFDSCRWLHVIPGHGLVSSETARDLLLVFGSKSPVFTDTCEQL